MMSQLKELPSFGYSDPEIIGVNIIRTGDYSSHCGLLYKDSEGENRFLHLAFHSWLRNELLSEVRDSELYRWVQLSIDDYLVLSVAEWCELVCKRSEEGFIIPYSLFFNSTTFTDDGIIKLGDNELGLSCSTFVLALLEKAGISIIELCDWDERDEDILVHNDLVELLEEHKERFKVSDKHISNVKLEVGCVRYRPEEVVAASILNPHPAMFHESSLLGQEIFQALPYQ